MAEAYTTTYTLSLVYDKYNRVPYGEAITLTGLQTIFDHMVDAHVDKIQKTGNYTKMPDLQIEARSVDAIGIYVNHSFNRKIQPKDLVNKHADFFRYYSTYKSDLYKDRIINAERCKILLEAIDERRAIQERLMYLQKEWFEEKMKSGGGGVCIEKYPIWDEIEIRESALKNRVTEALKK
jgi:hypothetical protein